MYDEEDNKRQVPVRTFIGILILIVIFILLLLWLLPMSNKNKNTDNNKVFNANLEEMKMVGISYYQGDNLPKNKDETVKMTLQEMLDKKLLLELKDKNGNSCSKEDSHVSVTNNGDTYGMTVNLKCGDEEKSISTTLGHYSYCKNQYEVCEMAIDENKDDDKIGPSCSLKVESGTKGDNGYYTSDVKVTFKSKKTSNGKITSFGIGTKKNYDKKDTFTVTSNGTTVVTGYVKDSNGKESSCTLEIKKDTVKPSCKLKVSNGTLGTDGKYKSDVVVSIETEDNIGNVNKFDVTEKANPTYDGNKSLTIKNNGIYKIYGYVKDDAGNTGSCTLEVTRDDDTSGSDTAPTPTPVVTVPTCSLKVTGGTLGSNGWYKSSVAVSMSTQNSTAYGIGTSTNYDGGSSYTVNDDGVHTIYGYVKDNTGKTGICSINIKKDSAKPSCSLKVISGSYNSEGYYNSDIVVGWNSKYDATSGIKNFAIGNVVATTNNETYTIKPVGQYTIYGVVIDNAGNYEYCSMVVTKKTTVEYQYKKDFGREYSGWSNWETYSYDPSNAPQFGNYELVEMKDLGKTRTLDYYTYTNSNPIYHTIKVNAGSLTKKYCKEFDYYVVSKTGKTYAVGQNVNWTYVGRVTTTGYPTDSISEKYVFVGLDWSDCGESCTKAKRWIWDKYTRDAYTFVNDNTLQHPDGLQVKCGTTVNKQVTILGEESQIAGYEQIKTPVYKDIYRYQKRNRTVMKEGYVDYKWSSYNDSSLINNGYSLTGNTRYSN